MKGGHWVLLAALALLVHAGYSATHFEALLLDRHGDAIGALPLDVYIEVILACLLGLFGALSVVGKLLPLYVPGESSMNAFHKLFAPRWDFAPLPHVLPEAKKLGGRPGRAPSPSSRG